MANANTGEIQLQVNPVAYTGNCFTLCQEFLQPLLVNYHLLVNYPQRLKQFLVQATGFTSSWNCNGILPSLYSFVHIYIYIYIYSVPLVYNQKLILFCCTKLSKKGSLLNTYFLMTSIPYHWSEFCIVLIECLT